MKEVEEEKEVKEGAVARLRRWPGAGDWGGAPHAFRSEKPCMHEKVFSCLGGGYVENFNVM